MRSRHALPRGRADPRGSREGAAPRPQPHHREVHPALRPRERSPRSNRGYHGLERGRRVPRSMRSRQPSAGADGASRNLGRVSADSRDQVTDSLLLPSKQPTARWVVCFCEKSSILIFENIMLRLDRSSHSVLDVDKLWISRGLAKIPRILTTLLKSISSIIKIFPDIFYLFKVDTPPFYKNILNIQFPKIFPVYKYFL